MHQCGRGRRRAADYKIGMRGDNFVCDGAHPGGLSARPMIVEVDISAGSPTQFFQPALEGGDLCLSACIIEFKSSQQHCNAPHLFALLGARGERPSGC